MPPKAKGKQRRGPSHRKEKSMHAARNRRSYEANYFNELAALVVPSSSANCHVDKAAVMRLTLAELKMRTLVNTMLHGSRLFTTHKRCDFVNALNGFLIVLTNDADILFVSENISDFLGFLQVDITGQNLFEFVHEGDHVGVRDLLRKPNAPKTDVPPSDRARTKQVVRVKCILNSKGKIIPLRSAIYKVLSLSGCYLNHAEHKQPKRLNRKATKDGQPKTKLSQWFVCTASPIPHPSNIEIPLGSWTFITRQTPKMKFSYVDERLNSFFGYDDGDLLHQSAFKYHHPIDSANLAKVYKTLFVQGQCQTEPYRFLAKNGGYAWVLTQATVISGSSASAPGKFENFSCGSKPHCIVCVNYILSAIEEAGEIFSEDQVKQDNTTPSALSLHDYPSSTLTCREEAEIASHTGGELVSAVTVVKPHRSIVVGDTDTAPVVNTNRIFTPRTKDMNKGYMMYSDEKITELPAEDEGADLTHLAPTAGDVCVPLDTLSYVPGMFDDDLFPDVNMCMEMTTTDDPALFNPYRMDAGQSADSINNRLSFSNSPNSSDGAYYDERTGTWHRGSTGYRINQRNSLTDGSPGSFSNPPSSPESETSQMMSSYNANFLGGFVTSPDASEGCPYVVEQKRLARGSSNNKKRKKLVELEVDDEWSGSGGGGESSKRYYLDDGEGRSSHRASKRRSLLYDTVSSTILSGQKLPLSYNNQGNNDASCEGLSHSLPVKRAPSRKAKRKTGSDCFAGRAKAAKRPRFGDAGDRTTSSNSPLPDVFNSSTARVGIGRESDSVLLNLLISGYDITNGYYNCYANRKTNKDAGQNVKASSVNDNRNLGRKLALMSPNNELPGAILESLLTGPLSSGTVAPSGSGVRKLMSLTQHDFEVNAPITDTHDLLRGQDLLDALDRSV